MTTNVTPIPTPRRHASPRQANGRDTDGALILSKYTANDIGNAHRLIDQHGARLRFVVNMGWYAWDGRRWARDEGEIVARKLAQDTAKAIFSECMHIIDKDERKARAKWAVSSGYSARLTAMLSQSEPHLAVSADDIDTDPWLFNCANGTLNLQTGQLQPHNPAELITKLCPVDYEPANRAPVWEQFLSEIFPNDPDLIEYLQRALGYSMTGITREHAMFIMQGGGSNGKSVMLETIVSILSDYARQCPSETFAAKDKTGSGISNDIARLVSARMVSVVETDQDRRLAEGLVKQATGGDRMAARYMRQEFFEFTPKFKIWLATNHKPRIQGTDHGMWRRIKLVPFAVTFYERDKAPEGANIRDDTLTERLREELPGILAWMVRGCAEWQEIGLGICATVSAATEEYKQSQDVLSAFLSDFCDVSPNYSCRSGLLYKAYKKWALDNGEKLASNKKFTDSLTERGFAALPGAHGTRMRSGLDLKEDIKNSSLDAAI